MFNVVRRALHAWNPPLKNRRVFSVEYSIILRRFQSLIDMLCSMSQLQVIRSDRPQFMIHTYDLSERSVQYIPKLQSSGDMISNDGNPLLLFDATSPPLHVKDHFRLIFTTAHGTTLQTRRPGCSRRGIAILRHALPDLG